MQAANPNVPAETPTDPAGDAVRVRARTSSEFARTMPVTDYFYTQLGPGRFEIASTFRYLDDVVINRTVIEPLSVGVVVPDPAWIAFVLPMSWSGEYLFDGAVVTPFALGVSAGPDGYSTRGAGRDGIAVGLQRSRFSAALAALRGVAGDEIRLPSGLVQLPPLVIARLRHRLGSMTLPQAIPHPDMAAEEVYELLLDACLDAHPGGVVESGRGLRWAQIVRKAEECFVAAAGRPVSLADLCAAAGVGRTALQHAFHGLYGESPLAYFHKRRLMQAREALLSGPPVRSAVKRAALGAGLHELGRFSVEYRHLFGERPSATLGRGEAQHSA